jgi:CBS domain-containing protein
VASERVFCRLRRESVCTDVCAGCRHRDAVQEHPAESVDCTIRLAPERLTRDLGGNATEVGMLLCRGTTVVDQSATLAETLRLLHADDRRSVPVVDADGLLLGVVHEMSVVRLWPTMGPSRCRSDDDVTWAMSTAAAIHESTPVRVALRILASRHLREATVVSSDGRPLGRFRDVDGLRWIARKAADLKNETRRRGQPR